MKKAIIIIISLASIIGCAKEIKITSIEYGKKQDYIEEHKQELVEVIVHHQTNGGNDCYSVDIDDAYNLFTGVKKIVNSGISVTDDYWTYEFKFSDDKVISYSFENSYYVENGDSFELLDFSHMKLKEENKIECE